MKNSRVYIRIEGVQKSVSDETVVQEFEGESTLMNGSRFVRYEEKAEDGDITRCLIKIAPDMVMVRKSGRTETVLTYEKNKKITCGYPTRFGILELELVTKDICIEEKEEETAVRILYSMTANGTVIPECELLISLRESD